ncbi:MAG TPA: hypothetical protein DCX14_05085 [Flavobacteriales bacterium]|nr:hypothetical protein [Flavobacteriales bacterium]
MSIKQKFMSRVICFSIACFILLTLGCKKDKEPINTKEELESYLLEEMETQNIPALATLVFKEDKVLFESYEGHANIDDNLLLSGSHPFLLASMSKTITAAALLRLFDQGEFVLDDSINNYLDFDVNVPGSETPITFRMLLTHTSGIADGSALDGQYYYGKDSPVELDYFLENYLVPGGEYYDKKENFHDFEPGEDHEYSNIGSALIAVLVEQISGRSFNDFCKEEIFAPLGMTNTFWRLGEIDGVIVQPYNRVLTKYEEIEHYTFTDYPNGGLRSTAYDMHRFFQAYCNDGVSNGYVLLKPKTVKTVLTPQIPDLDATVGLHMFLMDEDLELWGHERGEQGVATIMAFNKSTNIGAIILANQGDANLDEMLKEAYEFGELQ